MTVFHKTEPPWFESVKDLRPGGKRRLGDGFLASFNGRAYMRYDFREKVPEVWEPQMTLAERTANIVALREAEDSAIQSSELPELMLHPRDWPVEARNWLYKAGISNAGISAMGVGWSPRMDRVVVPVRMLDGTSQWIARRETGKNATTSIAAPKYLFPKGMKRGGGTVLYGKAELLAGPVVITEDYLSSWRVTKDTGLPSVSALGTTLDRDAIVKIAAQFSAGILWLDPDYYGQLGARQLTQKFGALDFPIRNVVSLRDPKNHEPGEVQDYVLDALTTLQVDLKAEVFHE